MEYIKKHASHYFLYYLIDLEYNVSCGYAIKFTFYFTYLML